MRATRSWLPLLALGCAPEPVTEIVVRIQSDMIEGDELREVRVRAARVLGATLQDVTFPLPQGNAGAAMNRFRLPGEVSLVARDPSDARPVRVDVTAYVQPGLNLEEFTHWAITRFDPGRSVVLELFLARRCGSTMPRTLCREARETCGRTGCEPGERLATELPASDCRANLSSDPMHCGACGVECRYPHAVPECLQGACGILRCEPGWADCNRDPADGCETDIYQSVAHCGRCELPCVSLSRCSAGRCTR